MPSSYPDFREAEADAGKKKKRKRPRSTTGYVAGPKGGSKGTVRPTGTKAPTTDTPKKAKARSDRRAPARKKAQRKAAKARRKAIGTTFRAPTKETGPDIGEVLRDVKQHIIETPERVTNPKRGPIPDEGALGAAFETLQLGTGGGVVRTLAKTAVGAKAAKTGEKALKKALKRAKGAPKRKVQKVKSAPARAKKRVKETPQRVKSAPRRARKAVRTKEGRRKVAKGAGRKVARRPVRTSYGAAAASPAPLPEDIDKRARAFAKGTAAALTHPKKVAETSVHGALGFLTAPLSITAAGWESIKKGSTQPLRHEIRDLVYVPADKTGTGRAGGIGGMAESLASGDPKKVEETTLQESGILPFIPAGAIARRVKRSESYKGARGRARGKAEKKRAKTREKRIEGEKAAQQAGEFVPKKKARKVRHSVPDTARPGEHYILRRTGGKIEKQRSRHRLSREVARMEEEGKIAGGTAGAKVAKKLRRSKGATRKEQNYGEAMRIFTKYGLPKNPARGRAFVQMLHESWPEIKHGDAPPGVHLDRHSTKFILDHPEIFRDKHFWNAIEEFDKQSKAVGTSPRNQFLAQTEGLINPLLRREGRTPILTPEQMVPEGALRFLPKRQQLWDRTDAMKFHTDLKALQREVATGKHRLTRKEINELNRKVSGLDRELEGLMKPPELGGPAHGVSTTRAVAWTPEMQRAFVKAARREVGERGLRTPAAYVADVIPSSLKGKGGTPAYGALHPVNKVWPSQGKAARSGNAESGFESFLHNSLVTPHSRRAAVKGLQRIFDSASREVGGSRLLTRKQWDKMDAARQIPDGVIPVRTQMLRAMLEGDNPVDPVKYREALFGEIERGQKLIAGEELAGELAAAAELGVKGEKFAPMDAVAMHELAGHMKGPGGVSVGMAHATNFATRTILNSPAFELAQFAQEGIPMAMALGRDLWNVPKAAAALAEIAKLDAESQAAIRAVVGSSVGLQGAPKTRPWRAEGFMDPVRAAGPKPVWRHAWEVVNGSKLNRFDRARAGRFREVGAIARIEGDLRRAEKGFTIWRSSANNLFKDMEQAVKEMKGMSRAERTAYVVKHPVLGDRLMKEMKGMAGNWNAYTVFEKHVMPFTVFYPFQRYSVLWALYHFPLDHPVVATALTTLGAVNAQELQRIAAKEGAAPGPLDYAKPVVGRDVLPAGQRFTAVLGSLQQAVLGGKPQQVLGGLSPALGIGIEAIVGKNSFTGAALGMSGWEYLARQGGDLSPLLHFVGVPDIGEDKSVASKAFQAQDPHRAKRSFLNPFIGQPGKSYAKERKLSEGFDKKYGKGRELKSSLPPEVWAAAYEGDWEAAKRLRKLRKEAERGSDVVRRFEKPFFDESGGKLSDEGSKILRYITGQLVLPAPKKKPNPFGIPDTDSDSLREQFGIPSTSPSELRKQFGIAP